MQKFPKLCAQAACVYSTKNNILKIKYKYGTLQLPDNGVQILNISYPKLSVSSKLMWWLGSRSGYNFIIRIVFLKYLIPEK